MKFWLLQFISQNLVPQKDWIQAAEIHSPFLRLAWLQTCYTERTWLVTVTVGDWWPFQCKRRQRETRVLAPARSGVRCVSSAPLGVCVFLHTSHFPWVRGGRKEHRPAEMEACGDGEENKRTTLLKKKSWEVYGNSHARGMIKRHTWSLSFASPGGWHRGTEEFVWRRGEPWQSRGLGVQVFSEGRCRCGCLGYWAAGEGRKGFWDSSKTSVSELHHSRGKKLRYL